MAVSALQPLKNLNVSHNRVLARELSFEHYIPVSLYFMMMISMIYKRPKNEWEV